MKTFLADLDMEALEAYVTYENCYREDSDSETENSDEIAQSEEEDPPQETSEDEDLPSSLA